MREAVGKHIRGQLPNAEFADLLSASRACCEGALVADADQPVAFETRMVHTFTVVEYGDRGILIVEVRREEYLYL